MKCLNHEPLKLRQIAQRHQKRDAQFYNSTKPHKQTFATLSYARKSFSQAFAILRHIAPKFPRNFKSGMVKPFETFAPSILRRVSAHKPQTRSTRLLRYCAALTPKGGDNYQAKLLGYCFGLISPKRKS
jgi:hypothetical protein